MKLNDPNHDVDFLTPGLAPSAVPSEALKTPSSPDAPAPKRGEEKASPRKSMVTAAQKRRLFRDLDRLDPRFIEKMEPFLDGLYKHYFRCEFDGWENMPTQKSLIVGNHNGLLTFEVVMLFYAWWKRFGSTRRGVGLAHGIALNNPLFAWLCPRIGAIPADPDVAEEALKRDYTVLVYPGGEKESFRPYKDRKLVDFYQRKGFIRLAVKSKVPIVPLVSVGAHESYVILHRGEEIAEALGLKKKYRLHGLPITYRSLFFMWCMVTGVFTFFPLLLAPAAFASIFVPMPAKMNFRLLEPIDPMSLWNDNRTEEENYQVIYDHVLAVMQKAVSDEYAKRKYPVIG
ncbi:MAG: 1-acyl-sn-glycerol-3-phosphate acyltransferase [Bacteriovoracia bacterium]